jgi:hypothetical protein
MAPKSNSNPKAKIMAIALIMAGFLSYLQYGTEQPLDQANGIVTFLVAISRLTDSENKNK